MKTPASRAIERNAIKAYTDEVGDKPEVKRWIKRFRKLVADMPPEIYVFVGGPTVVAVDVLGKTFTTESGGMHPSSVVEVVDGHGRWGGGDW